jgi:nifR3 family TIM-barrel protein
MNIGQIDLGDKPVMLAPMEDVTDASFRGICKEQGADMVYTEFIPAEGLIRDAKKAYAKLKTSVEEAPIGIQIYGSDPDAMVEAARMADHAEQIVGGHGCDLIDINFGCPVSKIAARGAGSGMMKEPDKMVMITKRIVEAVGKPVTVKTRLGWDDRSKIIVELAERLQDCGIKALTIHGRTRCQMYKGEADWTLIGQVKANPRMHIPVIGNGDVCTPARAKECFDRYGVDAVMVGRATFGAPWLFAEMKEYLSGNSVCQSEGRSVSEAVCTLSAAPPRSMADKVSVLKEHVLASIAWCGNDERKGIIHSRRHFAASPVFKGLADFKQTRIALLRAETVADVFAIMDSIVARWGND